MGSRAKPQKPETRAEYSTEQSHHHKSRTVQLQIPIMLRKNFQLRRGGGHAPMPPPLATLTTRPLAPNDEARHLTYLFCVHPIPRTFSGRFLQTVDVVGRGHARPIHGQLDVVPTTKHTTLYIQTLPSYMTAIAYEQIVNFTAINQQT